LVTAISGWRATSATIGSSPTCHLPLLLTEMALFQPKSIAFQSTPPRACPMPSGAPVSLMS
jgi:hypothetical protein